MADKVRKRNVKEKATKAKVVVRDDPDKDPDAGSSWTSRFWVFLKVASSLIIVPCLLLVFLDCVLSTETDPEYFELEKPPQWEGNLAPNTILSSAERLFENQLVGPESIVTKDGKIYTGTGDGKVVRVSEDGIVTVIAQFGRPPCGSFDDEPTCGRPLGMRFDKQGRLIVIDTYLGLYRVDVNTGKYEQLFPASMKVDGKASKFLNDIVISSSGDIFLTDSSWKWDRRHNRLMVFENRPYGRILKYNPAKNTTTVLVKGLYFPNGIELTKNEDSLLFVETTLCRVMRYYLKGPKAGQTEEFATNLPGLPDNIRPSSPGGYWLGIAAVRRPTGFSGFDALASRPYIRKFMTKILDQESLLKLAGKPYGMAVELDSQGKILRTLHDPSGDTIGSVSEVEDVNGVLYFGSYHAPYLGKLDLSTVKG